MGCGKRDVSRSRESTAMRRVFFTSLVLKSWGSNRPDGLRSCSCCPNCRRSGNYGSGTFSSSTSMYRLVKSVGRGSTPDVSGSSTTGVSLSYQGALSSFVGRRSGSRFRANNCSSRPSLISPPTFALASSPRFPLSFSARRSYTLFCSVFNDMNRPSKRSYLFLSDMVRGSTTNGVALLNPPEF